MKRILWIVWGVLFSQALFSQNFSLHEQDFSRQLYSEGSIILFTASDSDIFIDKENIIYYQNSEDLQFKFGVEGLLSVSLLNSDNTEYSIYTNQPQDRYGNGAVTWGEYVGIGESHILKNRYLYIINRLPSPLKGYLSFNPSETSLKTYNYYDYNFIYYQIGAGGPASTPLMFTAYDADLSSGTINFAKEVSNQNPRLQIQNDQSTPIIFDLVQDIIPPPTPTLESIIVDISHNDPNLVSIDEASKTIAYGDSGNSTLPNLLISMDPEDISDAGSGFKGYKINNFTAPETQHNFSLNPSSLGNQLSIRTIDNVGNLSVESISYTVIHDQTPPTPTFHLDQLELIPSNDGTWKLKLSVGDSQENTVQISDTGAGFLESSFQAEIVDEDDYVVSPFSALSNGICFANLSSKDMGKEYSIRISSMKDRVQNEIVYDVDNPANLISSSFFLPIFPSVDKDASQLSSSTICNLVLTADKDLASQNGTLELLIDSNSVPLGIISMMNWIDQGSYFKAIKTVNLNAIALPQHQPVEATLLYNNPHFNLEIDSWTMEAHNAGPQPDNIILKSNGYVLPIQGVDVLALSGLNQQNFLSQIYMNPILYFNEDNIALDTDSIFDSDGDQYSLKNMRKIGNFYFAIFQESYSDEEQLIPLEDYILPIRFTPDNISPEVTEVQPQYENENEGMVNVPKHNGFFYYKENPDLLKIEFSDISGLALVELFDIEDQYLGDLSIEGNRLSFPDNLELTGGPYTLKLFDRAYNQKEAPLSLIVDREAPGPLNAEDLFLSTTEEENPIRYTFEDGNPNNIVLDYSSLFQKDPLEYWSLEIKDWTEVGIEASAIVNDTEGKQIQILCTEDAPANRLVTLDLEIEDLAGNKSKQNIAFYTPAKVTEKDILISGTAPKEKDYTDWSDALGHHITFTRESHNWKSLQIEIGEDDQWRPLQNSPWDGTEDWIESDLSAHQELRYRLIPVNGSGAENRNAIQEIDITVGNYLPMVHIDDSVLIYRNNTAYLGPRSRINIQAADRDGDGLKPLLSLNGSILSEDVQNNLSLDTGVIDSGLWIPLLADAQPYTLSLSVRDHWSVDSQEFQGSKDISDNLSFTYDDKAPEAEFSLAYSNPQSSWSCNSLELRVNDAGSGTGSVVFIADDVNIDTENLNLYYDNLQELETALQTIILPEGSYTLRAVITDRLGNENPAPLLIGKVQNDLTPPQLLSVSPVKETQGRWNIGTPKVLVNISWQDNLSHIARVEYQYYQGDEIFMEGYKIPINPPESEDDVPLIQSIENLNLFPGLPALEERKEYNLKIRLVDQGGNPGEWVELPDAVCFNFTSPEMQLDSWNLAQINGRYYSGESTIELPTIRTTAETIVRYKLLDEEGGFIRNVESDIRPGSDGFYILEAEAQDAFGHRAVMEIPFCLDTTAPNNLLLQCLQGQPDAPHPGERILLSLSGEDQGCGIASYQLEIPGENVSLTVPSGGASRTSLTLPADINTGTHSLVLQAQDYLGKRSEPVTIPMEVNNSGEYILFQQPDYLGSGQRLSMSWNYHGPMDISHYELQLLGVREEGSSILFQSEDSQDSLSLNLDDVEGLESCRGLRLIVRPVTSGGERRSLFSSAEITLDKEAPLLHLTAPSIIYPAKLPVSWTIEEASPLKSVSLQLESITEDEDVVQYSQIESWQWQEDGRTEDLDLIPLMSRDLPDDVSNLRLRLTVCDLAENRSEILSGPIVIDRSPAPAFTIEDQGEFLNPDKNDLIFQWFWAQTDEEAGETGYSYQLSSTGLVDEEAWINTTEQETRDRTLIFSDLSNDPFEDNSQWFLLLKRHNARGAERILFSDGIIIDRSKPEIVSVELYSSAQEPFEDKFFTSQEDINIKIEARDNQSGIKTYQYHAGTWEGGAFHSLEEQQTSENKLIETRLPLPERVGSLLSYKIHCSNGAEELSLPSYSPSIMYNPTEPVVDSVVLSAAESTLEVQWSVHSMAPVREQWVSLYKMSGTGNVLLSKNALAPGVRSFRYYQEDLQDGTYYATVQMMDYASHDVSGKSAHCILDRKGPSLNRVDLPPFIYDHLNLNLQAEEAMEQISIRLDWSGREIYSREENLSVPLKHWQTRLDLTSLADWNLLNREDSAELILSVSARDRQGNWSSLVQNQIVFDASRPVLQDFSLAELRWEEQLISNPQLVPRSDAVNGITLEATSANSPITGYRWTICASPDEQPQDWTDYVALEDGTYRLNRQNISLNGLNLSQGQEFYIALAVQNQAGVYSETAWSPLLKASLRAPEFLLECLPETPDMDASVYTLGPAQVVLTPQNAESLLLKSTARLISPENSEYPVLITAESPHSFNELLDLSAETSFTGLIDFDKSLPGLWTLDVTLQDPFGRNTTRSVSFSANQGPVIDIPQNLSCRPGTPLSLRYQQWLSDSQGIARVQLYRQLEEGEELLEECLYQEETTLSLTLSQLEGYIPGNSYDYILKAEDSLGAWSQESFSVDFRNTSKGNLIENERWEGTHYLTGRLTIPNGITLTLADETQVLARSGSYFGSKQEIIIEADGALVLEGKALFSTDGEHPGALWEGIHFESPEAIPINRPAPRILDDLQVMNAVRGITVEPGLSLQFNRVLFGNNIIGLHLLSPWVEVNQCTFSGNLHYGIKEEENNPPIQTENTFLNNGYDTYDIQIIVPSQGDSE